MQLNTWAGPFLNPRQIVQKPLPLVSLVHASCGATPLQELKKKKKKYLGIFTSKSKAVDYSQLQN